jgi:hypothetical protein
MLFLLKLTQDVVLVPSSSRLLTSNKEYNLFFLGGGHKEYNLAV